MIERQIKKVYYIETQLYEDSLSTTFQMSCLQTLASRKICLCFLHLLSVLSDL